MITYVACDLFQSPARVLVNTVNTVGVMGKGIAKEFKRIYPEMFREYQQICEKGAFDIGNLWVYKTTNKWVLNFPTKRHWRQASHPEYIEAGLKKFAETYHVYGITSISFPKLGCGNGELDWETQVQPLMERYLDKLPVSAFIHVADPPGSVVPEHRDSKVIRQWLRDEPESLAFTEVWDDLCTELKEWDELAELGSGRSFVARVAEDAAGITLEVGDEACEIPSEAFLELWQQVRQLGFVEGADLPYGLDSYANLVVPLMGRLPYVQPVAMARHNGVISTTNIGLRLSPRSKPTKPASQSRPTQLSLLTGATEPE